MLRKTCHKLLLNTLIKPGIFSLFDPSRATVMKTTNLPVSSFESFPFTTATMQNDFVLQLGAELVFTQIISGEYLSFYWQFAQHYDLNINDVINCPLSESFCPVAMETYLIHLQKIITLGIPERCHYVFSHKGRFFEFDLTLTPIIQNNGNIQAVLVMGKSSKKTPEIPLSCPVQINQIAKVIRHTLDLETIWQQTVIGLGQTLNLNSCLICAYNSEEKTLKNQAEYYENGCKETINKHLYLEKIPSVKRALSSLKPMILNSKEVELLQSKSVLVVPTYYQNQANGVILLKQCEQKRLWTQVEIELVAELGEQVGIAIAHANLYAELEKARAEAEESSRLKSEFLASTSHELRTPLNGILGFLNLILDDMADDPEEQRQFIQESYTSALHLLNIINDILDIAKIEAGKVELEFTSISLNDLFARVEHFTRKQVQQKKLTLDLDLPRTHDDILVYGDFQRLLQIMLNLVGNAIKFTDEGGVTISAEIIKRQINFKSQDFPGIVKVKVADTGIGVSLDDQDRLFQLFTQVNGSRTRSHGGTGLGLVISQRLIEMMGGEIRFFSMGEGLGSTVTFYIPLYQQPLLIHH
jgi:signal transduction histidine kinase